VFEDKIYCAEHFEGLFLQKCAACSRVIDGAYVKFGGTVLHEECWKCPHCSTRLTRETAEQFGGNFVCKPCFGRLASEAARKLTAQAPRLSSADSPASAAAAAGAVAAAAQSPAKSSLAPPSGSAPHAPSRPAPGAASAADAKEKEAAGGANSGKSFLPLSVLSGPNLPEYVNKMNKEQYLDPEVFEKVFKMKPEEFAKLKDWKKKQLKQAVGLW
jgi:hypothetical protein